MSLDFKKVSLVLAGVMALAYCSSPDHPSEETSAPNTGHAAEGDPCPEGISQALLIKRTEIPTVAYNNNASNLKIRPTISFEKESMLTNLCGQTLVSENHGMTMGASMSLKLGTPQS